MTGDRVESQGESEHVWAAKLETLQNEVQIGLESGPGEELDMAEIRAAARAARQSGGKTSRGELHEPSS